MISPRLSAERGYADHGWLQARHEAKVDPVELALAALREPGAVARATATDPRDLTRQQAAVAQWLSRRYRVAPEPISRLVQEAWVVGQRVGHPSSCVEQRALGQPGHQGWDRRREPSHCAQSGQDVIAAHGRGRAQDDQPQ